MFRLSCLNFLILEKISICYFFMTLNQKGADNSNTTLFSTPFIELLYLYQYVHPNSITQAQHIHVYLHLCLHTQFHMSTCIYYLLHTCISAMHIHLYLLTTESTLISSQGSPSAPFTDTLTSLRFLTLAATIPRLLEASQPSIIAATPDLASSA